MNMMRVQHLLVSRGRTERENDTETDREESEIERCEGDKETAKSFGGEIFEFCGLCVSRSSLFNLATVLASTTSLALQERRERQQQGRNRNTQREGEIGRESERERESTPVPLPYQT